MAKRDYFEILGIDHSSGDAEIKSAYRKKAMQYHPDRNPDNKEAEEKFKEATEAYEVLKDPQKRQMYEQYGHAGVDQSAGGFGGQGFGGGFDLNDALRAFMRDFGGGGGGGGSIFEDIFGMDSGGGQSRRRARGEDLRIKLKLSLNEIANGVEKSIKVNRVVSCDTCDGSGVAAGSSKQTCGQCKGAGQVRTVTRTFLGTMQQVTTCSTCRGAGEVISNPCKSCRGEGRVRGSSKVNINVPAGVSSGNYMTIENMGNVAPNNGQPGDLIVIFDETEHDMFTRHADNIMCDIPVSFITAALGGTISVPTLEGTELLKVPSGTQPGKILKMRGKGIGHLNRSGKGDQLVRVVVWVPDKLNDNEKQLLKQLEDADSFKPPKGSKSFFKKLRETLGV